VVIAEKIHPERNFQIFRELLDPLATGHCEASQQEGFSAYFWTPFGSRVHDFNDAIDGIVFKIPLQNVQKYIQVSGKSFPSVNRIRMFQKSSFARNARCALLLALCCYEHDQGTHLMMKQKLQAISL